MKQWHLLGRKRKNVKEFQQEFYKEERKEVRQKDKKRQKKRRQWADRWVKEERMQRKEEVGDRINGEG